MRNISDKIALNFFQTSNMGQIVDGSHDLVAFDLIFNVTQADIQVHRGRQLCGNFLMYLVFIHQHLLDQLDKAIVFNDLPIIMVGSTANLQ